MVEFSEPVLLFDGVCNLCNGSVRFVLKHERQPNLRFASLQSPFGQTVCRDLGLNTIDHQSIIYISKGRVLQKSQAVIAVLSDMGGIWRTAKLLSVLPTKFSDWIYDRIAQNRYKWFGRQDTCMVPGQENADRFILD